MSELFTIENLMTLAMLTLLQAVLGFDNLLYISLESKRAPAAQQQQVRRLGIGLAVVLRILLLFVLIKMIAFFQNPFWRLDAEGIVHAEFTFHSVIVLVGGAFILYTATKEVLHMMVMEQLNHEERHSRPAWQVITWIVLMNLVFSFDSILSAIALTDVIPVMATAIVIGGILMIWLADGVAAFLQKNRMYEVLGLFVLFVVGVMLVTEGAHLAHLELFGREITAMTKSTFYFVIAVLILTDVVQGRYLRKLARMSQPA
jgi:predicted tellurium resistance membrane protein TerC